MSIISILGCGWLGIPLAENLISKGFIVKGSTTSKEKLNSLHNRGIETSIIDIEKNIFENDFFNCDILIISITAKQVDAFKILQDKIKIDTKVIYISSTSVYDNNINPVNETTIINKGRIAQIESILNSNRKFDLTILRFSGLIGPNRNPAKFFLSKEYIPNPNGYVNMIHLKDCIGIINAIINKNAWNEIFNGTAPHHPTRKEYYTNLRKVNNFPTPIFKELTKEFKIIDGNKVIKELNYQFKFNDLMTISND